MTLIIAAEGQDFVIIGADSLGTYGGLGSTTVCVENEKWYKVAEHVVILTAGDGGLSHSLINQFRESIGNILEGQFREDGVTNITNKFIAFCRSAFEHTRNFHFEENTFPVCVFIIAGLDEDGGVYKIPKSFVTMSYDDFMLRSDDLGYKLEGKPMLARYLFKKYYENAKSSADELISLVAGTLDDVINIARDGAVGDPISILKIDKEGIIPFNEDNIDEAKLTWKTYTDWKSLVEVVEEV